MTAVTVTYPHSAREEIYWIHHYHIVACFFSGNSLSAIDFPKNCLTLFARHICLEDDLHSAGKVQKYRAYDKMNAKASTGLCDIES